MKPEEKANTVTMTAEEWLNKYKEETFLPTVNTDGDLMASEKQICELMESYHKAKVESIMDDIINEKSFELEEHIEHRTGYRKGAKWLKSQLLK